MKIFGEFVHKQENNREVSIVVEGSGAGPRR